jgi:uncharacterized protein YecE (DUF72 family)
MRSGSACLWFGMALPERPSAPLSDHTPHRIGTAGWSIPAPLAASFPGEGQQLARYARVMNAVEINSSFYRGHQHKTYVRWAAMTPEGFRFAVKLPRSITHLQQLRHATEPLETFLHEVSGLQDRLGPLLVQLPPSLAFDSSVAGAFFEMLRRRHAGPVVCEPRHASWFSGTAEALMSDHRVGRVAADPAPVPAAAEPGGWLGEGAAVYLRLHGSPRMYWSSYPEESLRDWRQALAGHPGADTWCVFDNTAAGAGLANALAFEALEDPAVSE